MRAKPTFMSNITLNEFEQNIESLQRSAVKGHYKYGVGTDEFALILLRVAYTFGHVAGKPTDDTHLRFTINDAFSKEFEFPRGRPLRSLLGSMAGVIWSQNPRLPGHGQFSAYGDDREVELSFGDSCTAMFRVETANTNGKPLFFVIRHVAHVFDGDEVMPLLYPSSQNG